MLKKFSLPNLKSGKNIENVKLRKFSIEKFI